MTSNILVYETWICISRLEDTKPSTISVSCLVFCLRLMTTQQLCPMRGLDFIKESKEADSFWSKYVYRYMTCNLMYRKTSIFLWLPPLAHIWKSKGPNPPPYKGETNGWKTPRHLFKIFCFEKKSRNSQQTPRRKSMHARSHASRILPGPWDQKLLRSVSPQIKFEIWHGKNSPKDFQIPKMLGFVSCTCIL